MGKARTTKAKNTKPAAGIHVVTAGSKVSYNTGGHDTRKRTAEYAKSAKALKAIAKTLGKSWYFAHSDEPYQDHHGGGLWALDDEGWFFVRNLVGIEWSGQFCADPAKVDVLRQNARRFYAGFPKTFAAMKKFGIDLQDLLESQIATPDHVERWTDSICNASVPLPQRLHTGAVPKGGGVHNYPTPVTDIDRFRYDDFRLWVTDEEGKPVAVVPTNKRGGKDPTRNVKIIEATPGTKLYAKHERAQLAGKTLIADEGHPLAKQAFRKAKHVVYPDSNGSR